MSSRSKLAAPMGSQARWQELEERDVAAFKGLSHLFCIQIMLGSEKGESMLQQWAGNQILIGNLNLAQSRPQYLLVSIKRLFSGLPSIPDSCMCFLFLCSRQKKYLWFCRCCRSTEWGGSSWWEAGERLQPQVFPHWFPEMEESCRHVRALLEKLFPWHHHSS